MGLPEGAFNGEPGGTFGCGLFLPGQGPFNFTEFDAGGTVESGNGGGGGTSQNGDPIDGEGNPGPGIGRDLLGLVEEEELVEVLMGKLMSFLDAQTLLL